MLQTSCQQESDETEIKVNLCYYESRNDIVLIVSGELCAWCLPLQGEIKAAFIFYFFK